MVSQTRFGAVRQYPTDLAVSSIAAVVAYYLVTTFPAGSYVRTGVALPLLLFLPGYALTSALFPAAARVAREQAQTVEERRPGGIDTVERVGLAVALSLAVLPMLVIALALTQWHLTTGSVAGAVTVLIVVVSQLAVVRRLQLAKPERYTVSFADGFARVRGDEESVVATAASILLVLAVAVAGLALLAGLIAPLSAGEYTELGLYTEDENGSLVADGFPSTVEPGESIPIVLTIENHEGTEKEYTVVVQEQHLEDGEVVERTELREINARMGDGQSIDATRNITPETTEGTVRISFLLFDDDDGEPPTVPTEADALEDVYFWVTVGEDDDEPGELEPTDVSIIESDGETDDEANATLETGDEADTGAGDDGDEAETDDTAADDDEAAADDTDAAAGDTDDTAADDDGPSSILEELFGSDDE